MKQQVLSVASKLGRTAQQHNWKMSQNITDQMMIAIRKFLKGVYSTPNVWVNQDIDTLFALRLHHSRDSTWIRADDAYFLGEIFTLQDLSVWFCADKGFLSIGSIPEFRFEIRQKQKYLIFYE